MVKKILPLGKLLKEDGLVSEEQIVFSLQEQKATGERLGQCLMRLGLITDGDLAMILARQTDCPFFDLRNFIPDQTLLTLVPARIARQYQVLVLFEQEKTLHIAVADPYSSVGADQVYRATGQPVATHVAGENELKSLIERFYFILEHPLEKEIEIITNRLRQNQNLEVDVESLVNNLLGSAVSYRSTDLHITPSDISCRIMYRVDGIMQPAHVFSQSLHSRLITNIKVRAGMDISEQRRPRDGSFSFDFLGQTFDVRVSTMRTRFGENMVLRLLASKGSAVLSINKLGFEQEKVELLNKLLTKPYGMFLVTGPTGSGKTTTLYAALRELDSIGKNILTVEDPIEYELLMIRQTQVNEKADYTFSSAIRTFLRQDPDIMLVGEIRDKETAILAVRAALTGHLVLSTLHTNTAVGALARLRDLGVSSFLLSSSLVGVLAQRLIRLLCTWCRQETEYSVRELAEYELPTDNIYYKDVGCVHCRNTGYLGREIISEILPLSDRILRLVDEEAPLGRIYDIAGEEGFTSLLDSGRNKVILGKTSLKELQRVMG